MLHFLGQFLKNPRNIGAVAPSSRYLAEKMMAPIDFAAAKCIVEYGPGTGSFTEELIRHKCEETMLLLERTYKGDTARSDSESSGLGLAIAKRIVELHDGKLTVSRERDLITFKMVFYHEDKNIG